MANGNDRDVNFHIRATDESPKALKGAVKNVRDVTSALKDQAKQAELSATAAAETYAAINKSLSEAQEKAVSARRAYDEFSKSLIGVGDPTRKQVREFESLGSASERADKQVEKLTERLQKAEQSFNNKFSLYERALGSEADRAKAERGSLALATAIEEAERTQQVALARTAEVAKETAAQQVAAAEQREAAERAAATRGSAALAGAIQQAQEQQERLVKLDAFRRIGEDAEVGAARLRTFGTAASTVGGSTAGLAASLRAIIDPAAEARSSLSGLEAEITRVVTFVGEADKPMREYQTSLLDLGRIQNDLMRQGAAVDAFKQQEAAVTSATQAFKNAQDDVLRYAAAIKTAEAPNEALTANLRAAETALEASGRELEAQQAKLLRLRTPLDAAKIGVDNLAAAEERLRKAALATAGATEKLNKAASGQSGPVAFLGLKPYELTNLGYQLNDVFTQIASGTSVMQTFAQQGPQIVQIFPQLLTGALRLAPVLGPVVAVLGVFALGIKRIVDTESSVRSFSAALIVNADGARYHAEALTESAQALGGYGVKMKDASDALKTFMEAGADSTGLESLVKTAKDFADVTGTKVPEAAEKMRVGLMTNWEGVQKLDEELNFLTASEYEHIKALFESGDATEARRQVLALFTADMQAAADKQRGEWSDSVLELTTAWNGFLDALADNRFILAAMKSLHDLIATAQEAITWLNRVNGDGTGPAKTGTLLFGNNPVGRTLDRMEARNHPNNKPAATQPKGKTPGELATERQQKAESRLTEEYTKQVEAAKGLTAQQRLARAEADARNKSDKEGLDAAEQAKIDKETEKATERATKKNEAASRKAEAAAKRAQAQAEAVVRRREALENQLVNSMATLDARAAKSQSDNLDARLGAIDTQYAKIFKQIDDYEAQGGKKIGDLTTAAAREQVEANKELLKQQETMKFYDENLKRLESQRADEYTRLADAQDAGKLTTGEAYEAAKEQQAILGPQVAKMAQDAIDWAKALANGKPSPELEAFIARQEKIRDDATRTGPTSALGQFGKDMSDVDQSALNATLSERTALVSAVNDLYSAGAIDATDAQQRIEAAYAKTSDTIRRQVEAIRANAAVLLADNAITQTAYDALIAKMELVTTQMTTMDTPLSKVREQLTDMFASGVLDVFDSAAQSIAGLVDGTKGWGDAIGGVWNAFRSFAADFLRQIALMIIKQAILNALTQAASSSGGGFFSSLSKMIVGTKHTGGLGSEPSRISRAVSPLAFLNAPRYHDGYTPDLGIKSGERAAIIKDSEEVLRDDNPRHIKNWVAPSAPVAAPQDIKVVNAIDAGDMLSKAMATRAGQRVIVNFIKGNPSLLGGKS